MAGQPDIFWGTVGDHLIGALLVVIREQISTQIFYLGSSTCLRLVRTLRMRLIRTGPRLRLTTDRSAKLPGRRQGELPVGDPRDSVMGASPLFQEA